MVRWLNVVQRDMSRSFMCVFQKWQLKGLGWERVHCRPSAFPPSSKPVLQKWWLELQQPSGPWGYCEHGSHMQEKERKLDSSCCFGATLPAWDDCLLGSSYVGGIERLRCWVTVEEFSTCNPSDTVTDFRRSLSKEHDDFGFLGFFFFKTIRKTLFKGGGFTTMGFVIRKRSSPTPKGPF